MWPHSALPKATGPSPFPISDICGLMNFVILRPFKKKKTVTQSYARLRSRHGALGQGLAPQGPAQCSGGQACSGALQVSHGDQGFLDSKQELPAHWGHEPAILYTTVLRELRLWRPPPGSPSVAGALPLWAGSGGTSRTLLLSAESSRSAREALVAGRGCSRCRGAAPSPPPSPVADGAATAGSKASSSAGS